MYIRFMNYLAHLFLSGNNEMHALGNFMADDVKGKDWQQYPEAIQNGILLHRAIDTFTDSHEIFKKHVTLLFPTYRHYSRVIVDMYYDHFLAVHWNRFHPLALADYAYLFYHSLEQHIALLPEVYTKRIAVIKRENWLLEYAQLEGLKKILGQMERRTRFPSKLSESVKELVLHYSNLEEDFFAFFESLSLFCKNHPNAGHYVELPYFENLNSES